MVIRMDGTISEFVVAGSYRGLGEWLVRQPNIHTFEVVHRAEDGTETVLSRHDRLCEAALAASSAATEAHMELAREWEEGKGDGVALLWEADWFSLLEECWEWEEGKVDWLPF